MKTVERIKLFKLYAEIRCSAVSPVYRARVFYDFARVQDRVTNFGTRTNKKKNANPLIADVFIRYGCIVYRFEDNVTLS